MIPLDLIRTLIVVKRYSSCVIPPPHPPPLPQVHIHRDLHLRVPHKDPGQGLLCGEVHFPAGPVELAGFQRHPHGVSVLTHAIKLSQTRSGAH